MAWHRMAKTRLRIDATRPCLPLCVVIPYRCPAYHGLREDFHVSPWPHGEHAV